MRLKQMTMLFFIWTIIFTSSANAKIFEHNDSVGIFVGEISGYGEHQLQSQFLSIFRDQLITTLGETASKGKFHLVGSNEWTANENTQVDFSNIIKVDSVLQNIHMDAIAYGPHFNRATANAKMLFYAEKTLGEDYFWDDDKIEARRKMIGKPYRISQKMTNAAKTIGEEYGTDYLFFCNLMDAEIVFKNSIFKWNAKLSEKPKQIKVVSYFYLIDVKTGLVYEGYNMSDKTSQILNILDQKGINIEANTLLDTMFQVHAKRIAEDIYNEGTKILSKGK